MRKYITRTGKTQYKPSLKSLQRIILGENSVGFCLACGQERESTEPDARKYPCDNPACRAEKVYGAEELVIMGLFHD